LHAKISRVSSRLAGELGTGCVVVPIWGRTRNLPNIGTGRSRDADELIFVEGMRGLASRAERAGAKLYVEPINRYQNDVCVTIADALRLRERIGSTAVFVMGDVFHMNIEEADWARRSSPPATGSRTSTSLIRSGTSLDAAISTLHQSSRRYRD
jgi:sugar phosphate isomerase/epimerase